MGNSVLGHEALQRQLQLVSTELSSLLFDTLHGTLTPAERERAHQRIDALEAEFVELMDMLRSSLAESVCDVC
jgi:hypothetical protein